MKILIVIQSISSIKKGFFSNVVSTDWCIRMM